MMQGSVTRRSKWRETGYANGRFDPLRKFDDLDGLNIDTGFGYLDRWRCSLGASPNPSNANDDDLAIEVPVLEQLANVMIGSQDKADHFTLHWPRCSCTKTFRDSQNPTSTSPVCSTSGGIA